MNPEALERLELRLAWLEHANQEMSEELYRQQREIEGLRLRVGNLQNRLEAALAEAAEGGASPDRQDERPPHY
jgi:SlyX protein